MVSVWKTETEMGTYTTNYNLFMPTVGETGWGELVNGNFTTIDTTMKSLSNRITTCESYGTRITAIENEVNGNLNCTSVTTSGKITGNGGIAGTTGTFSGAVTGTIFNGFNPYFEMTWNRNYYVSALGFSISGTSTELSTPISISGSERISIPKNTSTTFPHMRFKGIYNIKEFTNPYNLGLKISVGLPVSNTATLQITSPITTTITINNTTSGRVSITTAQANLLVKNPIVIKHTGTYDCTIDSFRISMDGNGSNNYCSLM